MDIPGLPDNMPDDVKKQVQEFMKKIMAETGCSPEDLKAIVVGGKGVPGMTSLTPGGQAKPKKDYFDKAKETGLEIPEGASEQTMRTALLYCLSMCFNLTLANIELKNILSVHGVRMSVTGVEEAKNLKKIIKLAEEKLGKEPKGSECIKAASKWIMKKTKKESK